MQGPHFAWTENMVSINTAPSQDEGMPTTSIAVIGASNDRRKYGNKAVRAFRQSGFEVFPVTSREPSVEGLKTYRSVEEIAAPVEIVCMYVPPAVGIRMLDSIAKKKPQELWLNPGSESDDLLEAAADLRLRTMIGCSMEAFGMDPHDFPDNYDFGDSTPQNDKKVRVRRSNHF